MNLKEAPGRIIIHAHDTFFRTREFACSYEQS